jgi:hypothetical protein
MSEFVLARTSVFNEGLNQAMLIIQFRLRLSPTKISKRTRILQSSIAILAKIPRVHNNMQHQQRGRFQPF